MTTSTLHEQTALRRQELCAALGVSESTVSRWEKIGLPFTPIGTRHKRYDLAECKTWLRENNACLFGKTPKDVSTSALWSGVKDYTESFRSVRLRVTPSA